MIRHLLSRLRPVRGPLSLLYLASALAVVHVIAFSLVISPSPGLNLGDRDQTDYERLAQNILTSGSFSFYAGGDTIVPEPYRTLGYPFLLAFLYRIAGEDPNARYRIVIGFQALLFAIVPLLAYVIARHLFSRRSSVIAAFATALYPPLAYYAAQQLTDFPASVLVTGAVALLVTASEDSAEALKMFVSGVLTGVVALVRPSLLVLGPALAGITGITRSLTASRQGLVALTLILAGVTLGAGPQFWYTFRNYGSVGIVADGPGAALWWGYWQGLWPGKAKSEIDRLTDSFAPLDVIGERARDLGVSPSQAIDYASVQQRYERARNALPPARWGEIVGLEADLGVEAIARIRSDPFGYMMRGLTYRTFFLWAGDVTLPVSVIQTVPRWVLYAMWAPQLVIAGLAAIGAVTALRRSPRVGLTLLVIILATWALYFPFLTLSRYSLPAKPIVLILAVGGAASAANFLRLLRRQGNMATT